MKRVHLVPLIKEKGIGNENILKQIVDEIIRHEALNRENVDLKALNQTVSVFLFKLKDKLNKCNRMYERVMIKENKWLQENIKIQMFHELNVQQDCIGRPRKSWEELGDRSKRQRVADLALNESDALALAAAKSAKLDPTKQDMSFIIKQSTTKATDMRKSIELTKPTQMSAHEALALKIQCNLSDDQYQMIRNSSIIHNANIYPTLHRILEAKYVCYPQNLQITETSAEVPLQDMVNHTLIRVLEIIDDDKLYVGEGEREGIFYLKCGFDGASSQSVYKQRFDETELEEGVKNENSLFQTGIVPLKLVIDGVAVWNNAKPSSAHFCRPLHLQYKKESTELSKSEEESINTQIENLVAYTALRGVKIKFKVDLTMFDGKVINALTDTLSTQSCNICGVGSSDVNKLDLVRKRPLNENALKYGLSILHCWIRCFEYVLHLGYKLENQSYQARTPEQKVSVQIRKKKIQKECREKLSLIVDVPKVGFGNSNDGNTARKAFANSEVFSQITGVQEEAITRLRNILIALSSGLELNLETFTPFCHRTAEYLVANYGWYKLPPSVHKMLEHGGQVAAKLELAIGLYSEEAQETQNKEIRSARLHHSAKVSRINAMTNQFHYLLIRTDPVISSISFKKQQNANGKPIPEEVLELLM